jgi:hypothetical protein
VLLAQVVDLLPGLLFYEAQLTQVGLGEARARLTGLF